MRTALLATLVSLWGSLFVTSHADAQVNVYTMNTGPQASVYPPFGYGGVYPGQSVYFAQGQNYSSPGYTGQVYTAPVNNGQVYTVPYNYSSPYAASAVGYGGGYYPAPVYNNPYYGGFLRYAQYRNRRYGGGHMFYSYFPQYQNETSGLFDR